MIGAGWDTVLSNSGLNTVPAVLSILVAPLRTSWYSSLNVSLTTPKYFGSTSASNSSGSSRSTIKKPIPNLRVVSARTHNTHGGSALPHTNQVLVVRSRRLCTILSRIVGDWFRAASVRPKQHRLECIEEPRQRVEVPGSARESRIGANAVEMESHRIATHACRPIARLLRYCKMRSMLLNGGHRRIISCSVSRNSATVSWGGGNPIGSVMLSTWPAPGIALTMSAIALNVISCTPRVRTHQGLAVEIHESVSRIWVALPQHLQTAQRRLELR